jgi:TonB-linked SusC/RagA family outer membrane protein
MKKPENVRVLNFLICTKKIFLIMKLTAILLTLGILQTSAITYSQKARLSLAMKDTPVSLVFQEIEKQTNYRFLYRNEMVEDQIVTVTASNLSIENVLDLALKNVKVEYTILDDNLIVITPAKELPVARQLQVRGKVTMAGDNSPLPGVNILEKGTMNGAVTDIKGMYSLTLNDPNATLVFSFVGCLSEEIKVEGQSVIDVSLVEDIQKLDEVVVVGYGTQKKITVTGSVATAKGEEISESPVANITNSIAGRISGISMRAKGGQPGFDNPDIHIRGIATSGNNSPLIVVDGIIRNNINQIDPNNIETISVLKDAAAVAPYGMGGANGVILITTKSGKSGESSLSFSTYYGIQTPCYKPEMLSARDYKILLDSAVRSVPDYIINNYDRLHAEDPDVYPNSNFFNDVADLKEPVQNYNLQLSGGEEKINYFAGLGYFKQDGMFENLGYERYSYNLKIDAKATKTTKVTASIQGSVEDVLSTQQNPKDILWQAVKFIPSDPMTFSNGLWGASDGGSPVGNIKAGYDKNNIKTLLSSISIEQQIPFINGLSIKGAFSYDPTISHSKNWFEPVIYYQIEDTAFRPHTYSEIAGASPIKLSENYAQFANYTYQAYLNYRKTFGKHEISILGVAEASKSTLNNFNASNQNFIIEIDELSLGSSNPEDFSVGGGSETGSQVGYVYRIGDNYANKYIIEASGRYDGHYTFAPDRRYGFFPSFSFAWRISEESFLKNKLTWLSNLKIRGSWGKSGNLPYENDKLAKFQYLNGYTLTPNEYAFGLGNIVSGSYIPRESNPAITWETSTKANMGFDLSLWRGIVTIEADYFHEDRNNMLIPPSTTVPVEYGLKLSLENAGKMLNNGIEIAINSSHKFSNGIDVGLTGNFSYAENKVVKTFETAATRNNPNRQRTGRQLNTPFGYHSLGLFSVNDDKNHDGKIDTLDGYRVKQFAAIRPGDIKYADLSGPDGVPDGKIDQNDETVIGYPTYPAITYGFTPTFAWKGFDLSLFFQGAGKVSLYIANFQTQPFANNKSNTSYEYFDNYWRLDRQDARYPRLGAPLTGNNTQYSDFWMSNSSYLRLKNAVIGYRIPSKITSLVGIKSLRAYFSGQNLLTLSKIKFMDPEEAVVNTAATYFYPIQKVYTFGLDVTF